MRSFQDTFETRKRSFISAFSICMTVPLTKHGLLVNQIKNALLPEKITANVMREILVINSMFHQGIICL